MKRYPVLIFAFLSAILSLAAQPDATPPRTTITSERLEMQGTYDRNFFYFQGQVEVLGTDLHITCEEMTVVALRSGRPDATVGEIGAIESIVASGNVVIEQAGRRAFAGRAEVDPAAGTVTLSQSPRVIDGEVEVSGYQFVINRTDRKFLSIPDPNAPTGTARSTVSLGKLPESFGFNKQTDDVSVDDHLLKDLPPDLSKAQVVDPDQLRPQAPPTPPAPAP